MNILTDKVRIITDTLVNEKSMKKYINPTKNKKWSDNPVHRYKI